MNRATHLFFKYLTVVQKEFVNWFFPSLCAACGIFIKEQKPLCAHCYTKIRPVVTYDLSITAAKAIKVYAVSSYIDPLKKLILAKHYAQRTNAVHLGMLMHELVPLSEIPCDYIVPVPLHWSRYAWRGYNQANEIAKIIGKKNRKPIVHALTRIAHTPYQAILNKQERAKNVKAVFRKRYTNATDYKGKHIVLVDDVMTTGATLHACARALSAYKPASITAIVACRVI